MLIVITYKIIIIICEHHRLGVDDITLSFFAEFSLAIAVKVEILKGYFPSGEDPVLNGVDAVIYTLV